jgi:hypothetical protein
MTPVLGILEKVFCNYVIGPFPLAVEKVHEYPSMERERFDQGICQHGVILLF